MIKHSINEVTQLGFCTGCGLCEAIAKDGKISVELSNNGYYRPVTKTKLSNADVDLINLVCPGVVIEHQEKKARNTHPIWGPVSSVSTGYSTNPEIRRLGSSGGVISALAIYLLESGKVNFVAQNAVDPHDPIGNQLQVSRNKEDVLRASGSRYAPSAPLKNIEYLLSTGEVFAFIGKPCDIAALRALSKNDDRIARQIPFMLSFMCAGIPSRHGTLEILEHLNVASNDVYSFRYRGDGWPGKAKVVTKSGDVGEMDYSTSWGSILNKYLQFRCKICPDGTGEFADIVCADAWYGKDGYPSFEEKEGRSLVISRTGSGDDLLKEALRSGALFIDPLAIDEIAKMQPYQVMRKQMLLARLLGAYLANFSIPRYKNMGLVKAALSSKIKTCLRNAVGTYFRVKKERV